LASRLAGKTRSMNSANSQPLALSFLKGLVRKIAAVFDDCRYAQRRIMTLRTAADMYAVKPDPVPGTYAEFLFRTSGVLPHEPSARARRRRSFRQH
jgi:hypothetical protein